MAASRRITAATVLALAALPFMASSANAESVDLPAQGPTATISLRGSHGYRIDVNASSNGASASVPGRGPGRDSQSDTTYSGGGGRVTMQGADVRMGHLLRMAARFIPTRTTRRMPQSNCRGGRTVEAVGVFVGTIRFEGEGGYTRALRHRAPGRIVETPPLTCQFHAAHRHRPHHRKRRRPKVVTFVANSAHGIAFSASRAAGRASTRFIATMDERREGISIVRLAFVGASVPSFTFDTELDEAEIAPPAPFSGSGRFERIDEHASRWEGSLAVSFPGAPDVLLSGRDFSWRLSSGRSSGASEGFLFFSSSASSG